MKSEFVLYPERIWVEGMHTDGPGSICYHMHDKYELGLCKSGRVLIVADGTEITLNAPFLMMFRPYTIHYVLRDSSEVYERMIVYFDDDVFRGVDRALLRPEMFLTENADAVPLTEAQFSSLYGIAHLLESWEYAAARQTLLWAFLCEVSALDRKERPAAHEKKRTLYICDVVRYIGEHYAETITTDELAARFFVSVPKLNRDFRFYTQTTVREMLIRVRLQNAARLLESGGSVSYAALNSGFASESHFIRTFRKYYGTTPYQYGVARQKK